MIEDTFINLISNVGFPIAAFLLMWYQNTKVLNGVKVALEQNTAAMREVLKVCRK